MCERTRCERSSPWAMRAFMRASSGASRATRGATRSSCEHPCERSNRAPSRGKGCAATTAAGLAKGLRRRHEGHGMHCRRHGAASAHGWAAPFAWQCIPIVAQPMHPCLPLSTPCALHDSALVCASTQLQRAAVVVHQARSAVVVAVRAGPARASARRSASGHGDGGSEAASAFSACQHIMYCDGFGGRFWVPSTGGFGFRRSEWSCGLDGL